MLAVCDGKRAVALAPAQDFKRVGDGDAGPNTGGMGAYSPVPGRRRRLRRRRDATASSSPTLAELRRRGIDYRGVLYAGLMLTADGPEAGRVQRPLRRPRGPGRAAPAHRRPRRAAGRGGRRRARSRARRSPTTPRSLVVAAPPRATPAAPRTGDVIDGPRRGRAPSTGVDRVLRRRRARRRRRGSSPPAAGCSTSSAAGPTVAAARGRAYEAVGRHLVARHAPPHRHRTERHREHR